MYQILKKYVSISDCAFQTQLCPAVHFVSLLFAIWAKKSKVQNLQSAKIEAK